MTVKEVAAKYENYIIDMRREFHRIPESQGEEYKTSEKIKEELTKMGVNWKPCGMKTGVLVTFGQKTEGKKCVLLRADIDGLSVTEETGLDFTSEHPGMMHACGHDNHIAMLLGCARILKDMEDQIDGEIRLAFQPAEEIAHGAQAMVAEGAMKDVDACFSMHVWPSSEAGSVSVEAGERMASAGQFKISVRGKGGHASSPHMGVDVVPAMAAIIHALQTIPSRETNPQDTAVVTIGRMEAGSRWNVIADRGVIEGTTRTFSQQICKDFPNMIKRIAKSAAAAYRVETEFYYRDLTVPVINDERLSAIATAAAEKVGAPIVKFPKVTGGEDFCWMMQEAPGVQAFLGIIGNGKGEYPNHHSKFDVDESCLLKGASVYAQYALDVLKEF